MMLISTSLFPVVNLTPVVAGARSFTANRRLRNASRAKIFFSKQNGRRVMRVSRYRPVVYLQLSLLFLDIFINSFGDLFRAEDVILLVLYIIQDVCILFAVIVVFLVFFNTYIFQAGLVFLLIRKFKTTIIITVLYLLLSLGLHVWTMTRKWGDPETYIWNGGFQVLYVFQRLGSVLYYYYYKKTCLKLGDPRFYQESEWLRREFARVH